MLQLQQQVVQRLEKIFYSTRYLTAAATTAKQLRMVRVASPENKDQTAANCSVVVKVNLHQYTVGSLATGI